jgi:arylsulfatase A-like enzyme
LFFAGTHLQAQSSPNVLLVIADDLGVDRLKGYHEGGLLATTPTLDSLRGIGVTFENVFAAPKCTPTRGAIMSGKFGVKTGVLGTPGNLDLDETSLFEELESQTGGAYVDALVGKWHLSAPEDPAAPNAQGADYFMGFLGPSPEDYFAWTKTENGLTTQSTEYASAAFTDASIRWINEQADPWFLWLAHAAPHSPFHEPPAGTYSVGNTSNNGRKYVAMIENMDFELRRLLDGLDPAVRANTLVIFAGDNGTPGSVIQDYPSDHSKGTLYQGGVRVPLIVAGAGGTRQGERDASLVHLVDIHATILEAAGAELPGGLFNSLSIFKLLSAPASAPTRAYNYTEIGNETGAGYAIRNAQYKYIVFDDGTEEMYDLAVDSFELADLVAVGLTAEQIMVRDDLLTEATALRTDWSCRDEIQNGTESGIDCGGSCIACEPLPVELLFFTAAADKGRAKLNWRTISEIGHEGFSIEHSTEGAVWDELDFLATTQPIDYYRDYEFIHERPTPGLNYYRLKQLDLDGDFTYSQVRSLRFSGGSGLLIFPNPSYNGHIQVALPQDAVGVVDVRITDATGKVVDRQQRDVLEGEGCISLSTSLIPGIYFLSIGTGGTVRFVVL